MLRSSTLDCCYTSWSYCFTVTVKFI